MRITFLLVASWLVLAPAARAQTSEKLALILQDLYGPNGLRVDSQAPLPDGSTHTAHFNSAFQSEFTQLNIALASQLAALPLPSPASGFTYTFDRATGTFTRSTQSFGPILTDRAETIGRGKFLFGYNAQSFSFHTLEGLDLNSIPAVFTHDDFQQGGGKADVVATVNSIQAAIAQLSAEFTYGITNRLDASVAVPLVHTALTVRSDARIVRVGTGTDLAVHFFADPSAPGGFGDTRTFSDQGTATGLGDVIVRVKGTVLREANRALAAGVEVRAPTGDEENLLGSGATGVKPFLAFSTVYGRFAPHINIAYQWNGSSVLAGNVKTGQRNRLPAAILYAAGADLGVNARFTLAVDVLGQRVIDSPRLAARTFTASGPAGTALLPDITFANSTYSITTGSAGFKLNIAKRILANFNLRFELGSAGLADRASPLLGIEYGF